MSRAWEGFLAATIISLSHSGCWLKHMRTIYRRKPPTSNGFQTRFMICASTSAPVPLTDNCQFQLRPIESPIVALFDLDHSEDGLDYFGTMPASFLFCQPSREVRQGYLPSCDTFSCALVDCFLCQRRQALAHPLPKSQLLELLIIRELFVCQSLTSNRTQDQSEASRVIGSQNQRVRDKRQRLLILCVYPKTRHICFSNP